MNEADSLVEEALRTAHELTQRGHLDAAEEVIERLRSSMAVQEYPVVAVQIMVTEGCVAAYRGDWARSRDRLERSRLLAVRIGDKNSELLASSWLSYVAFIESDFDRCLSLVRMVLEEHKSASGFAVFRASAIVVLLLHLAGRSIEAEQWFRYTKRVADSLRQPGATSLMIFDIAAMRASSRRFDSLQSTVLDQTASELDLVFARSAQNFDEIGSVRVMPALHYLLESQVLNALGRFDEAKSLLRQTLASPDDLPKVAINQARLELFWSLANAPESDGDVATPEEWQAEIDQLVDDDDIAVYCGRASRSMGAIGAVNEAARFESESTDAARRFGELRRELWERLMPIHGMLAGISTI